MNKLYKLKNWYSLEDAAQRLTMTLGEEVSENDILQMSLEGHLNLSWYMRHVTAQQVAPAGKAKYQADDVTIAMMKFIEKQMSSKPFTNQSRKTSSPKYWNGRRLISPTFADL